MARAEAVNLLKAGQVPERYTRNIGTIGLDGQMKLLAARVAIVGAGGLGGNVVEQLARQGVGFLRIIDGDIFAAHNLNRQLLATEASLGQSKAIVAAQRVAAVNVDVTAEAVPAMLDADNAPALLTGIDVVVDALDTITSRLLLGKVCRRLGLPLVHGAIAGFTGQVTTILPDGPGLEKIYKSGLSSERGVETALGNPAPTPALAAALQAQEVVKLITGVGQPLTGRLLFFDTEINLFEIFTL
jgi:molybdopterin/thiamine biosynthesis adenylyltransferase